MFFSFLTIFFDIFEINMKKIRIAIADDQYLFRKGVISLLKEESNLKVTLEVDNGISLLEALEKIDEQQLPHIIFMDIRMPGLDGLETTKRIVKKYSSIKIIALTMFNSDDYIVKMHRIGAHGFLTKDAVVDDLLDAVDMVLNKGVYYNEHTTKVLLNSADKILKSTNFDGVLNQLSSRELDVVRLICFEKTNYEIAEELGLSIRTIEWHKKNVFGKLKIKSTIGLMKFALENGLI
jgi:DNA-binding NarL/FixJ family response regulator